MGDGSELSAANYLGALLRRKWIVGAGVALGLFLGSAYALFATPVYRATLVLVPAPGDHGLGNVNAMPSQLGGLAALAGVGGEAKEPITDEALAVLRSREFVQPFLEKHHLLQKIFWRQWDEKGERWTVAAGKEPSLARGYKYFVEKMLFTAKDRKTGLVTVSIEWRDPKESAQWANEIVESLNAEMRSRAATTAEARIRYLQTERDTTQLASVRDAIGRLIDTEMKQSVVAAVTPEFAFRPVDVARPPDVADVIRPNRPLVIMGGALAGFILGSGLVLARALLDGSLWRSEESRS